MFLIRICKILVVKVHLIKLTTLFINYSMFNYGFAKLDIENLSSSFIAFNRFFQCNSIYKNKTPDQTPLFSKS